jgi:hypothetical protein
MRFPDTRLSSSHLRPGARIVILCDRFAVRAMGCFYHMQHSSQQARKATTPATASWMPLSYELGVSEELMARQKRRLGPERSCEDGVR